MTFHVTTLVGQRVVEHQHPITNPFLDHVVAVGLGDLLLALLRYPLDGALRVRVGVNSDQPTVRAAIARLDADRGAR